MNEHDPSFAEFFPQKFVVEEFIVVSSLQYLQGGNLGPCPEFSGDLISTAHRDAAGSGAP